LRQCQLIYNHRSCERLLGYIAVACELQQNVEFKYEIYFIKTKCAAQLY